MAPSTGVYTSTHTLSPPVCLPLSPYSGSLPATDPGPAGSPCLMPSADPDLVDFSQPCITQEGGYSVSKSETAGEVTWSQEKGTNLEPEPGQNQGGVGTVSVIG